MHGHDTGGAAAAVVNDQLTGAIRLPATSLAPLNEAVWTAPAGSAEPGVNVAVVPAPSTATTAGTAPPGPVNVKPTVAGCTGSLNVALTTTPAPTPVAPAAGERPVTVGAVVSGVPPPDPSANTTSTQ